MRKKEFKLLLATNPKLYEWMKENRSRLKANLEVMFYLTRHPDGMRHFQPDAPIDNQEILRESRQFMKEMLQEREERKNRKKKPPQTSAQPREPRRLPLLENLKTMFGKPMSATSSANKGIPSIRRQLSKAVPNGVATSALLKKKTRPPVQPFSSLKFKKLSRKKVMDTLNQTTEMLDVVGALIGNVNHLK